MDFAFDIPESVLNSFDSAIKEYYQATGKDAAYVVNRQALNVAIKTAQNTPLADAGAIRSVAREPWWPKYVAKQIKRGKGVRLTGKKGKRYGGRKNVSGKYTREEARAVSKQLIKNRIRKRGYIRSGWSPAIARLGQEKLRLRGRVTGTPGFTKRPDKAPGDVVIARPGIAPVCEIINKAAGADKIAGPALVHGMALAAADMREYVRETYGGTARKFNAK